MNPLVLLVRHGVASYREGRLYGWTPGVHLSPEGQEQVKQLAVRLEPIRLAAVYSSPLERCMQTAEAITNGRRVDVRTDPDLGEVQYGSWQGRSYKSLMKTKLWRTVQLTPSQATFPGGESLLELQHRGVTAIEGIRRRHRRGVVVAVSHADMIKAILAHYLGMHLDLFQRINVDAASVSAISFGMGFPRVLRISDTGNFESLRPAPRKRS